MYNIINLKKTDWKNFRAGKIGASFAPAILEKSPFENPDSIQRIMKRNKNTKKITPAMKRGLEEEPKALAWFCKKVKAEFKPAILQSKKYPWMVAALDGFNESLGYGVEIKTPGIANHRKALSGRVPYYYWIQIQHQICVSDAKKWVYLSWDGKKGICITVKRDERMIKKIIGKENSFRKKTFSKKRKKKTPSGTTPS